MTCSAHSLLVVIVSFKKGGVNKSSRRVLGKSLVREGGKYFKCVYVFKDLKSLEWKGHNDDSSVHAS